MGTQQSGNVSDKQTMVQEEVTKILEDLQRGLEATARAAAECRKVVGVVKQYGPLLEVEDGGYVGIENRPAARPGSDPHFTRAKKDVLAVGRTYEEKAFQALEGERPPRAALVVCRYGLTHALQGCHRCKALESNGDVPCAAIQCLDQLRAELAASQAANAGPVPAPPAAKS